MGKWERVCRWDADDEQVPVETCDSDEAIISLRTVP